MIQAMMNTDTPAAGLDGMMQDRGNQRTTFDARPISTRRRS